jgi:hypothetical protein
MTNLILGNLLLPLGRGKYETLGGKIYVHLISSVVASVLLILLFRIISSTTKKYKLILFPIILSYFVPLISVYLMFFLFGLTSGNPKGILIGIPLAIISSIVSWFLWVPFGLMNSGFVYWYSISLNKNQLTRQMNSDR